MKAKHQRLTLALLALGAVVVAGLLALSALKDQAAFFYAPSDVKKAGLPLGRVRAVEDHGAGAFLVLEGPPERLVPFTRAAVPAVDVGAGRITVVPPAEIVVDEQEEGAA